LQAQQFVSVMGEARSQVFAINESHPLAPAMAQLFAAETQRWDNLLIALRAMLQSDTRIVAAWYYGSVSRDTDVSDSDLDLAIVVSGGKVDEVTTELRETLQPLEASQAVTCSVVGIGEEDLARLSTGDAWWSEVARDAKRLVGKLPSQLMVPAKKRRPK
jgi:predicted nucleotidyltransferase